MTTIEIRLRDQAGKVYKWFIQWQKAAYLTGGPLDKGRHANGWLYTSHDGTERFVEGNWLALLPAFKLTASNYGLELCSELS